MAGLKLPQVQAIVHSWAKTTDFSIFATTQQFETAIALIRESWGEDKISGNTSTARVFAQTKIN